LRRAERFGRAIKLFLKRRHNELTVLFLVAAILAGFRLWPHPALQSYKPSSVAVYDDKTGIASGCPSTRSLHN
jgi:hypothetical protein